MCSHRPQRTTWLTLVPCFRSPSLHGMIKSLGEQHATPDINDLSFDERFGLMVDRELTEREDARLTTRLKAARLRHNACLEDIDYRSPRGLDKAMILQLGSGCVTA